MPAILFEQIERVKENECTQVYTPKDRQGVSSTVKKARKILEQLEKIKDAILNGNEIPEYIRVTVATVTPKDISELDIKSKITESEIKSTEGIIAGKVKNPFNEIHNESR